MGAEAEKNQIPKLGENPNPNSITEAQFAAWKLRKEAETYARKAEAERKRGEDIAAGLVEMNGRELFMHDPSVFDNTHY